MMIRRLLPIVLVLLSALYARGQSCVSSTCNAATPAESDVIAAWPTSGNTNSTVTINIPSGSANWTSQFTETVPAAVTTLIISGASTVSCSGTAGTSGYACTPTDNTVIIDNIAGNFGVIQINGSGSGSSPLIQVTGLTMQNGSGGNKFQGLLLFYSNSSSSQIRVDHSHFNLTTGTSGTGWAGRLNGPFVGVMDHNVFDNASPTNTGSVAQGFMNSNTLNDSLGFGDGSWAFPTGFGGSNFMFYENNVFNGGLFGDCIGGGKFVARYNTFNSDSKSSSWIHNHGTAQNGGRTRSCRAFEAYNNYFNAATTGSVMVGDAGGTGLICCNTVSRTSSAPFIAVGDERNDGGHSQSPTPGEWGYCGIGTLNPSGPTSNWDGNVDSTGRACLDGIGRGQGIQALNGANFPSALNSTTGTIAWPEEYLEPVYAWMNTLLGSPALSIASPATAANRDVYTDNASFTGATGTGFGVAASRPATCTAGPGGAYGASPTGSYGVAYFETDTGLLDICTATNTWGVQFNPEYTYPHPLAGGPTTFSITGSVVGSGSLGGTNCATGTNSFTAGTSYSCTATPAGGWTFAGWSGGTCIGLGSCSGSLGSNITIIATFTGPGTFTLSTTITGGGSGTITGCAGSHVAGAGYSCTVTATGGSTLTSVSGCGGSGTTTFAGTMPASNCTVTATIAPPAVIGVPPPPAILGTVVSFLKGISDDLEKAFIRRRPAVMGMGMLQPRDARGALGLNRPRGASGL